MLELYGKYSRKDVQEIFEPGYQFSRGAGSWGLQGVVSVKDRPNDWVFFVTYGQSQAHHSFEEGITSDGVLTWQSQPSQGLDDRRIQRWINQDPLIDNIYLFLRPRKGDEYYYLGTLQYLTHDADRERPVWFQFQISEFAPDPRVYEQIKGHGDAVIAVPGGQEIETPQAVEVEPPKRAARAVSSREFKARKMPDLSDQDERNKSLGLAGEKFVVAKEKERLIAAGLPDLASKVLHSSVIRGDGLGYDVMSFFPDGSRKYIEVKTTRGSKGTGFYLSPNELAFSQSHPESYQLHRVFNFDEKSGTGQFFILSGDVSEQVALTPTNFKASFS